MLQKNVVRNEHGVHESSILDDARFETRNHTNIWQIGEVILETKFKRQIFFSAWDRNFALEMYGEKSMCFDHTDQMWEERSCQQVQRHYSTTSKSQSYQIFLLVNEFFSPFFEVRLCHFIVHINVFIYY